MKKNLVSAVIFAAATLPFSAIAADDHHVTVQPDALKWTQPAALEQGALQAVVSGDPTKEGMYIVRQKFPSGFKIQAHSHPNDENVTVLMGILNIGTGDKLDQTKGVQLKSGAYSFVAKGMTHYAWATEETVIQLHGMGPQGVIYVNAADDPRKK